MKKLSNQDIINNLRKLPEDKKIQLAFEANIRGIDIENQLVPTIVNLANIYIELLDTISSNYKLLLGENYNFLNR